MAALAEFGGEVGGGLWSPEASVFGQVHLIKHGNSREQKFSPKFAMEGMAWSPDASLICTASGDKSSRVFEVGSRKQTFEVVQESWVRNATFTHDGLRLCAVGDDATCRIYELEQGQFAEPVWKHDHARGLTSVAFSPNDKHLMTSSIDKKVRLFQVIPDPPPDPEEEHEQVVQEEKVEEKPACHNCGEPYVNPLFCRKCGERRKRKKKAGKKGGVPVDQPREPPPLRPEWEGTDQIREYKHLEMVYDAKYSKDGKKMVASLGAPRFRGLVQVWDVEYAEEIIDFEHDDAVTASCFSPDGKTLGTACMDKGARVLALEDGLELRLWKQPNFVQTVDFSHDGRFFASACHDGFARIFDMRMRTELHAFLHPEKVTSAKFSPDSTQLATTCGDGGVRIWGVIG